MAATWNTDLLENNNLSPDNDNKILPVAHKKPKLFSQMFAAADEEMATNIRPTSTTTTASTSSAAFWDKPCIESREMKKLDHNCFLLEDTTLEYAPRHLQQLLQHYDPNTLTQAEALFLLVYIVALENGNMTQQDYYNSSHLLTPIGGMSTFHIINVRKLTQQPPSYTKDLHGTVFTMKLRQFTYAPITNETTEILNTLLSGFVSGDLLLVTLSPAPKQKMIGYSCSLSIGRYILITHAKQKPFYHRFRKLNELSRRLRNEIFVPMRVQQLRMLNILPNPSLHCLPIELYEFILKYLTTNQRKIFLNVSKHIYLSCLESKLIKSK